MDQNSYVVCVTLLLIPFACFGHCSDVEQKLRKLEFRIDTLQEALNMRTDNMHQDIEQLEFETRELWNELVRQENKMDRLERQLNVTLPSSTPAVADQGLKGMAIGNSSNYSPRLEDDSTPFITGTQFLPDGQLIVCDFNNEKIKLLNRAFTVVYSLRTESRPLDVAAVNFSTVIVTLPFSKQLQYVYVKPSLQLGNIIELNEKCPGVDVLGEEIFISCHLNSGDGEIRVLDMNGVLKRKLGMNEHRTSYILTSPSNVAVSVITGNIYVSDWETDKVTCFSSAGEVMYQFSDPELEDPSGIYIDAEDSIIVCGSESNTVQIITDSGKKGKTLIRSSDGLRIPLSVDFRGYDNTLVVGFGDGIHASKLISAV